MQAILSRKDWCCTAEFPPLLGRIDGLQIGPSLTLTIYAPDGLYVQADVFSHFSYLLFRLVYQYQIAPDIHLNTGSFYLKSTGLVIRNLLWKTTSFSTTLLRSGTRLRKCRKEYGVLFEGSPTCRIPRPSAATRSGRGSHREHVKHRPAAPDYRRCLY